MVFEVGAAAIAVAVIVSALIGKRKRSAAFRAMAMPFNLKYLGTALPGSLKLAGTEVANASTVWNVIDGERHGIRVIAFGCRIGTSKGSWRRTIIAARTSGHVFAGRASHLEVQRSGQWTILFEPLSVSLIPKGLIAPSELSAYIEGI